MILAATGCEAVLARQVEPPLPVCGHAPAPAPSAASDTLHVVVRVTGPGLVDLLVRVDPPGESDIVFPSDAPESVAAAALSIGTRGVFQVCAAEDPIEIGFRTSPPPFERGWLRVTTRRPVRARVEFEDGTSGAAVAVDAGRSGRTGPVGRAGEGS
jgi:hypothetical protein